MEIRTSVSGTDFQRKVWQTVMAIPLGETRTYKQVANIVGHPRAYRAVGTALGKNPLPLLVPCHRVLPSKGGYGAYRWGKKRKIAILAWEQMVLASRKSQQTL